MHRGGGETERQAAVRNDLSIETRAAAENEQAGDIGERLRRRLAEQPLRQTEQSGEIIMRQIRIGDRDLAIGFTRAYRLDHAAHQVDRGPAIRRAEIGDGKGLPIRDRGHAADRLDDEIADLVDHRLGADRVRGIIARAPHRDLRRARRIHLHLEPPSSDGDGFELVVDGTVAQIRKRIFLFFIDAPPSRAFDARTLARRHIDARSEASESGQDRVVRDRATQRPQFA